MHEAISCTAVNLVGGSFKDRDFIPFNVESSDYPVKEFVTPLISRGTSRHAQDINIRSRVTTLSNGGYTVDSGVIGRENEILLVEREAHTTDEN